MDVYDVEKLPSFKRFGFTVECMTAYDDILLVCIKGGQLLQYVSDYNRTCESGTKKSGNVGITQKQKIQTFCSKPVSTLVAIPESSLLLATYDNMMNVHDLETFEYKSSLQSTKGITEFDVYVKETFSECGKIQVQTSIRIAAAVGKKIAVLKWNGEEFEDERANLVLKQPAKALLWSEDVLFIGFKDEYFILKPETSEIHEVFAFGGEQKVPLMTRLPDDTILLGHELKSVFVNCYGRPVRSYNITWSGVPRFIVLQPPYIVAVLHSYIEVKSIDPSISIQRIDLKHVNSISKGSEMIFLESHGSIQMLVLRPYRERLKSLLQFKHYDLALQILSQSDAPEAEKQKEIDQIRAQQAVHMVALQKFEQAFEIFFELNTDILHIVGLIKNDFVPKVYRNSFEYPEKVPSLHGADLDSCLVALVEHLTEKRKLIVRDIDLKPFTPIMEHKKNVTLKSKDEALQVIDTTLFKCYLQICTCRISELIQMPGNRVVVHEAVKGLKQAHMYRELIILYKVHKMHVKALDLMKSHAVKNKSVIDGMSETVDYLQTLGRGHLQLIFDYASWVIESDPQLGLKIFTDEKPTVSELPRFNVYAFLIKHDTDLAVSYLEHVIYVWKDNTAEIHAAMSRLLKEKILPFLEETASDSHVEKRKSDKGGNEKGSLEEYRKKMLKFLNTSTVCAPEEILTILPLDSFFEERAILYGRMGKHEAALGIYVYVLNNSCQAQDYCAKFYSKDHEDNKNVYLSLMKIYLNPPLATDLGLSEYKQEPQADINQALDVLREHAVDIEPIQALDLLPDDIRVRKVIHFLETALQSNAARKKISQAHKGLQFWENLQFQKIKMEYSRMSVTILEDTRCQTCKKKIGDSIFVRDTEERVMHMFCYQALKLREDQDMKIL